MSAHSYCCYFPLHLWLLKLLLFHVKLGYTVAGDAINQDIKLNMLNKLEQNQKAKRGKRVSVRMQVWFSSVTTLQFPLARCVLFRYLPAGLPLVFFPLESSLESVLVVIKLCSPGEN